MPYTVYVLLRVCSIYLVHLVHHELNMIFVLWQQNFGKPYGCAICAAGVRTRVPSDGKQMFLMLRYPLIRSQWMMKHCLIICLMSPTQAVTQVRHHHQVPVPVPLPMEAPVQASLFLTDKKDHCHLA